MRSFKVRVEGHREAPEGKVEVTFTNQKPPKKPEKDSKEGACPPSCYDPWMESVNLRMPLTKEEAAAYPVGHFCKVTLEPTGAEEPEDESEEAEESDEKEPLAKRQAKVVREVKEKYAKS